MNSKANKQVIYKQEVFKWSAYKEDIFNQGNCALVIYGSLVSCESGDLSLYPSVTRSETSPSTPIESALLNKTDY